ncbi:MAG: 50S ribosomal protein L28 [Anaerolineae bacterium]|jgi:large subunit ribosomal protein L28|nr:MAG: 50S ribosomal protein L28 [Anaerolineae bacterium]MCL4877338.1 50S ribosomal protein L28 [Anaerolineae bacterium]
MAKCEYCGKHTQFGRNKSFSQKRTPRTFRPNLQKTKVIENGKLVKRTLCTQCIRTASKMD